MARTFRIQVTADHIKRGRPESVTSCPIALACREGGLPKAAVGYREFFPFDAADEASFDSKTARSVPMPVYATKFAYAFDSGAHVLPFEFVIDLPDHLPFEGNPHYVAPPAGQAVDRD